MKSSNSKGLGICSVLLIIFVVLKLTGNIAWSWWWVLSPLWLPLAILILLAICFAVFASKST